MDISGLAAKYWHLILVGVIIIAISLDFLIRFVFSSWAVSKELKKSIVALTAIRGRTRDDIVDLDEIGSAAMAGHTLSHLWSEYTETLHPQREENELGQSQIVRWRASALAEMFFTDQAVVDSRLCTEYFKHVPGILTGLGIIGTFAGLISGLTQFKVLQKPEEAQKQLELLVNSVGHAFLVSGAAIFLAMLFTWSEKSQVAKLYRHVEKIREIIDSLFKGGAGEEYLQRLVEASEMSSTHAAQIKDSLVVELKEILAAQTAQQIEAQSRNTGQISGDVGRAIAESLSGPMMSISDAVRGVSSNQGDAVNRMLTDVLSNFSAQMRDMFGGQLHGMSDLLKQTSETIQASAVQFNQLAANMNAAGTGTVDAMGARLSQALDAMEARQHFMNTQMGAFVDQIRSMVAESQTESSRKLQGVLTSVGEQVAEVVSELRRQAEASAESQGHRQERFEKTTGQAIGSLSAQTERLITQSVETNKALQTTIAQLASGTDKAIGGMRSGAEVLAIAASDFAKAGQGVADTMRTSTGAVETIKTAAGHLSLATAGAKGVLEDYGRTRDIFALMVTELKLTVENARRDASMTSEFVARIEAATHKLSIAQEQSEDYLNGVSDVLVKAHDSFAQSIEHTLRKGNSTFQGELSSAVGYLSGAIKELGDVVDGIPVRK